MDARRLEGVSLFSGLSNRERETLARWTDEVSVEVTRNGERVAELGRGEFFGEIGLLETERRTASVAATTPMKLIVMFRREFAQMEHDLPGVADRIRSAIRARLSD